MLERYKTKHTLFTLNRSITHWFTFRLCKNIHFWKKGQNQFQMEWRSFTITILTITNNHYYKCTLNMYVWANFLLLWKSIQIQNIQPHSHIHSLDIANIILTYFGYKNVIDKGYAEILYKMKRFVFFPWITDTPRC